MGVLVALPGVLDPARRLVVEAAVALLTEPVLPLLTLRRMLGALVLLLRDAVEVVVGGW